MDCTQDEYVKMHIWRLALGTLAQSFSLSIGASREVWTETVGKNNDSNSFFDNSPRPALNFHGSLVNFQRRFLIRWHEPETTRKAKHGAAATW